MTDSNIRYTTYVQPKAMTCILQGPQDLLASVPLCYMLSTRCIS